jgi:hypothetical protein
MSRSPRATLVFVLSTVFAVVTIEQASLACSYGSPPALVLDPQAQASDTTPPSVPVANVESIRRGQGPTTYANCSQSVSSCDDFGSIGIALTATDDQAPTDKMGYRVEVVAGQLPDGLALPTGPVLLTGGHLYLHWIDGATDDQEAVSFTLAIRAVDLAGNTGPPANVEVSDGGSGCSLVGRRIGSSWAATVVLLLMAARFLRRSRRA